MHISASREFTSNAATRRPTGRGIMSLFGQGQAQVPKGTKISSLSDPKNLNPQIQLEVRTTIITTAEAQQGLELMQKGDFVDAIACFTRASFLIPREMSYILHRAECYFQLGDLKSAIDNYKRVCQFTFDPRYVPRRLAQALFINGMRLFDMGNLTGALEEFEKGWRLFKRNDQLVLCAAICHLGLDHISEAFTLLEVCLATSNERHLQDPDIYVLRAKIHQYQEDIAQVYHNLEIVRSYRPEHPEIPVLQRVVNDIVVDYRNKAFELVRLGEVRKAITCLTKAIHILKDNSLLLQRGILFHQIGDYRNCINDLEPIVEQDGLDSIHREVITKLADSFYHQALEHLPKTLTILPNSSGGGEIIGWHSLLDASPESLRVAVDLFTRSVRYDPTHSKVYLWRGECYAALDQLVPAYRDFDQCLSLDPDGQQQEQGPITNNINNINSNNSASTFRNSSRAALNLGSVSFEIAQTIFQHWQNVSRQQLNSSHEQTTTPLETVEYLREERREDLKSALAYYALAIKYLPAACEAHFQSAQTFLLLDDVENATVAIMECLKLEPSNVKCQLFLLSEICKGDQKRLLELCESHKVTPFPIQSGSHQMISNTTFSSRYSTFNGNGSNNNVDEVLKVRAQYEALSLHIVNNNQRAFSRSPTATATARESRPTSVNAFGSSGARLNYSNNLLVLGTTSRTSSAATTNNTNTASGTRRSSFYNSRRGSVTPMPVPIATKSARRRKLLMKSKLDIKFQVRANEVHEDNDIDDSNDDDDEGWVTDNDE